MLRQVVAGYRLAAVLVYPLQHLISGRISQTGEERDELPAKARIGLVLEDNGVELGDCVDLELIHCQCFASEAPRRSKNKCTLDSLLIRRFAMVSTCRTLEHGSEPEYSHRKGRTGWKTANSEIPAEPIAGVSTYYYSTSSGASSHRIREDERSSTPSRPWTQLAET